MLDGGPSAAGGGALAAGWVEMKTPEGKVYYANTATKQTQWERPASAATGPAAAAQGGVLIFGRTQGVPDAEGRVSVLPGSVSLPVERVGKVPVKYRGCGDTLEVLDLNRVLGLCAVEHVVTIANACASMPSLSELYVACAHPTVVLQALSAACAKSRCCPLQVLDLKPPDGAGENLCVCPPLSVSVSVCLRVCVSACLCVWEVPCRYLI